MSAFIKLGHTSKRILLTGPGAQHKVKLLTERAAASKNCQQHAASSFQRLLLYTGSPTPSDIIVTRASDPEGSVLQSISSYSMSGLFSFCSFSFFSALLCSSFLFSGGAIPSAALWNPGPGTNNQYSNAQVHTSAPGGYKIPQPRAAETTSPVYTSASGR